MGGNNEKINTLTDLYKRVLPALKTKVGELKRENIPFVSELDVWNYCVKTKWKNKHDLRIYEIVDDILNEDGLKIEIFVRKNIVNYKNLIDKDEINER